MKDFLVPERTLFLTHVEILNAQVPLRGHLKSTSLAKLHFLYTPFPRVTLFFPCYFFSPSPLPFTKKWQLWHETEGDSTKVYGYSTMSYVKGRKRIRNCSFNVCTYIKSHFGKMVELQCLASANKGIPDAQTASWMGFLYCSL